MYRLGAVGLLAASSLLVPCLSFGQQMAHVPSDNHEALKIDGTVYYGGPGNPAANIMVNLTDGQGDSIPPVMTNEAGGFRFGGLNPGQYSIVIREDGYQPLILQVDLTYASERGIAVYLKPNAAPKAPDLSQSISAHELSMPPKARELMDSGKKKLYDQKDARASLDDFQRAAAAAPGFYEPYFQIGMADMTLGDSPAAEQNFRKSIELSADKYAEAEVGLGSLLIDQGNYADGAQAIRRGIELAPSYWLGYYELGRMQMNQNLFADAEKSAGRAKALEPTALIVYRLLSNIHMQEKNYPALLEDLDAYIKLDPKSLIGIHAQQLRMQVAAQISKGKLDTAADSKQ